MDLAMIFEKFLSILRGHLRLRMMAALCLLVQLLRFFEKGLFYGALPRVSMVEDLGETNELGRRTELAMKIVPLINFELVRALVGRRFDRREKRYENCMSEFLSRSVATETGYQEHEIYCSQDQSFFPA
jgi:hypothetical protein